ncbi:MAG: DUF1080 domain-containing protein [Bryobacterales bacterium]|nr:DUF1080 domain-containing protein [Bryobacterales bacterium]
MRFAALILVFASFSLAGEWQSLFDGKSFDGWRVEAKPADRNRGFWSVVDGAIRADSMGRKDHDYVWLIRDGEFADFELHLQVRDYPESTGNSGVQIRSRWDAAKEWLHGPQVDIHPPTPWRNGLIYDETWEARRWIHPSLPNWDIAPEQGPSTWTWRAGEWNQMEILCRGGRITTKVNGVVITDKDLSAVLFDEAHQNHRVGRSGQIALQLHTRDELKIEFKDIRIRTLP